LELTRYIHLNPLRAGIVRSVKELDRYPWTGHSAIVGLVKREWQDRIRHLGSPIKRHLSREKSISSVRKLSSSPPYLIGRSEVIERLREGALLGLIGATTTAFLVSLLRMLLPWRWKVRCLSYQQGTIWSHQPLSLCRSFFGFCSVRLGTSRTDLTAPVTHQDQGLQNYVFFFSSATPVRFCEPRKSSVPGRVQFVSYHRTHGC
jgi:hypothetical protein